MSLSAFTEADYKLLIQWIKSEEQNYLWSGPTYQFPLDEIQIHNHCSKKEALPFLFRYEESIAGYVELYRISKRHYRICRVLIAEEFRGKGLSKLMLNEVIEKAVKEFG